MKTFADIKFKKHRVIEGAIQGRLTLDNGIELSVIAGPSLYSLPRDKGNSPDDFEKFEVAVIDKEGMFIGEDGDVQGWQTRKQINQLIEIWS